MTTRKAAGKSPTTVLGKDLDTMRGVLINPKEQTVTEVMLRRNDSREIQRFVGGPFTITPVGKRNLLHMREDALLHNPQFFFELGDLPEPIAGNGLVLGSRGRNNTDTTLTVEQVREMVSFISAEEAKQEIAAAYHGG
jgi:hypothetical protein